MIVFKLITGVNNKRDTYIKCLYTSILSIGK
nr:MAG TPA: hypothetical protein [Caudoviricetes sp.]